MVSEKFLQNTGKIRDICFDVCSSINNLIENKLISAEDKSLLTDYYNTALKATTELTELGYFNKKMESNKQKQAQTLIETVLKIENYCNNIVKKLWAKDITDISCFNENNFKLCVRELPLNLLTLSKDVLDAFNSNSSFYATTLISNKNLVITPSNFESYENEHFAFGVIYNVSNSSFIMASESSNICNIKELNELTDNVRSVEINNSKVCINGGAVKLKTPNVIINNNLETPLQTNNNVVILDGNSSKPIGIFCLGYSTQKINLLKRRLAYIAKQLDVPLIEIDILKFYKNNKAYLTSNTLARNVFNKYVDLICKDLQLYCRFDFIQGAKKLIGLNTNLRYNFLFKFIESINGFITNVDLDDKQTAELIVQKFLKAVDKHNLLTKKREKANGKPLFFPNETMFISLPTDFLN